MTTRRILAVLLLLAAGLCLPLIAGEKKDENAPEEEWDIILRHDENGRKIPVPPTLIKQDDYTYVIGKKGAEIKVPSCFVTDVQYRDRDANYSMALEKRDEGRYPLAALYFTRALESKQAQKWVDEYCNYGIGDALYSGGHFKGYQGKQKHYGPPSEYFAKALAANPKSRFLPEILVKLPVCLAEEGKLDEADAKLKEAETRLKSYRDETIKIHNEFGKIADRANAQLAIADARIAERKASAKKGADAKAAWNEVKEKWLGARFKCSKFPESLTEAVEGVLRALIMMQDYNGAKAEAETIIEKYKKDGDAKQLPLLPIAYVVLGKANLAQAVDYENKKSEITARNSYAEARWAFLNVIAQFFENDEYIAEAHFFAGLCYDKLKDIESDASEKAIRHWRLIVQNFPKSNLKDDAEKELQRVGAPVAAAAPAEKPAAKPAAAPDAAPKAPAAKKKK